MIVKIIKIRTNFPSKTKTIFSEQRLVKMFSNENFSDIKFTS